MQVFLHPLTLQLNEPFTISRDSYTERATLIVELSHNGYHGYGEGSAHRYYQVTSEALLESAQALCPIINAYDFVDPEDFHQFLYPHLKDFPFLHCAFDNAAHDLYGKMRQQACHQLWGLSNRPLPKSSFTLSIAPIEQMIEKIKTNRFDIYKIKLGTDHDIEMVKALRQHTNASFRVDANCAWSVAETIENSKVMKALGVAFIEQPLQADDWEGMEKVFQQSALPIIADEACRNEKDIEKSVGRFHGINIKLMKCGGLTPALSMIKKARSHQLKVMVGCMVESSVGIAAIAQLLPLIDYVDMDGALFLSNDPAQAAKILADGSVVLPSEPGLGVVMNSI